MNNDDDRTPIDLSDGFYDYLEERLSQFLDLKILMIRDWKEPQTCNYSRNGDDEKFSSTDPDVQNLTRAMMDWMTAVSQYQRGGGKHPGPDPISEARMKSLLSYLEQRDPTLAKSLYEEEAESLAARGHVTLRDSNAIPAKAVIIFDTLQKVENEEQLIASLFPGKFKNAWGDRQHKELPIASFIENFDVALDDYRAYKALHDIRYALRHQFEHDNKGDKNSTLDRPYYYDFARLYSERTSLYQSSHDMSFEDALHRYGLRGVFARHTVPVDDKKFQDKILYLGAINNLLHRYSNPKDTFARMYDSRHGGPLSGIRDSDIAGYATALSNTMRLEIDLRIPEGSTITSYDCEYDPRVIVPLFREVMMKLDFDAPGQLYLNTIWTALQTYMPSLANAPVPTLLPGHEPPRNVLGYGNALPNLRPPKGPQP
ncbi:MAG: hypothetical protein KJ667_09875 [Alphaproteobacteria bacterium]|nr:hypothetical protein [Alphaproteobacteria bacterium]